MSYRKIKGCYGDTECSLCKDETECNLEMKMRCGRLGVCMYYKPKLVSDVREIDSFLHTC